MPSSRAKNDLEISTHGGQFVAAPRTLAVSNVSNVTATPVTAGRYRIMADVPCHVRQVASNAVAVAASNAHRLAADAADYLDVSGNSDDFIAVIGGAAEGTIWISRR